MSYWPSCKAKNVLAEYTFAFHDADTIGPVMMSKIGKKTGLTPRDL